MTEIRPLRLRVVAVARSLRRARRRGRTCGVRHLVGALLLLSLGLGAGVSPPIAAAVGAQVTTATVTGVVFHDYTVDGIRQARPSARFDEPGVGGVTVRAFDASGALVDTTTTAADGTYTLQVASASTSDVRIEFTTPDGFRPSVIGPDAGPSIQFATAGASGVDFAVQIPDEFCQANPRVFVACYYPGSIGRNGGLGALMSNDWLMRGSVGDAGFTPATPVLTKAQAGSVWGVAIQRQTGLVFTSAVVRRHAALGPQGIGGLYVAAAGTPGLVVASFDLSAAPHGLTLKAPGSNYSDSARGMTNNTSDLSLDIVGFNGLGTEGIGDIDITPDGRHLYVTNLYERSVVRFELTGTAAAPALGPPSVFPLPADLCAETERPWALQALDDGSVLVGVNCITLRTYGAPLPRACTTADCSNVSTTHEQVLKTPEPGVIMRLEPDGANGAGSWTELSRVSFDYPRETDTCRPTLDGSSGLGRNTVTGIDEPGITGIRCRAARWHPWTNDWRNFRNAAWREYINPETNAPSTDSMHFWPQPIISDIEVLRDGSLAIGIADRFSMQVGANNHPPTNTTDKLIYTWVHGDLRLICLTADGYVEEQNGSCGPTYTSTRIEYFHDAHVHREPVLGGLALHPGDGTIATTVMDPVTINSSGLLWFSVAEGTKVLPGADFIPLESSGTATTFRKASGMGDVELLCDFAPVSLGDRVWWDEDEDGLQDPGEPGIAGVTVRLYDADGELVATTVTDADGRYLFTSADGLRPDVAYTVRFDEPADYGPGGPLEGFELSDADRVSSEGSLSDAVDSDAFVVGDGAFGTGAFPRIAVAPLEPGDNDYAYDAGFTTPSVSVGDLVWLDVDRDGIQDPGEQGIAGVVLGLEVQDGVDADGAPVWVSAVDVFGRPVADVTTDADGRYLFDRLPPGTYRVSVVTPPPGLEPTVAGAGPDRSLDSSTGSAVSLPLLVDGASDMTLDFGFIEPRVSVGDLVWFDTDGDGIRDADDPGIAGVTVTLLDADGNEVATTTTDAEGRYRFDDLPAGTYRVEVTPPSGFTATTAPSVTSMALTTDGQHDPTLDFGFTAPHVRVGDRVWFDTDGDGLQGPDDPGIAGVTLTITTADGDPVFDVLGRPVTTTVTDADGNYVFDLLPPGQYRVTVTPPWRYAPTVAGAGGDRALDSSTGSALSVLLTGTSGSIEDMTLDFGFVPAPPEPLRLSLPVPNLIPAGLDPSRDVPIALAALLLVLVPVMARRRRDRGRG